MGLHLGNNRLEPLRSIKSYNIIGWMLIYHFFPKYEIDRAPFANTFLSPCSTNYRNTLSFSFFNLFIKLSYMYRLMRVANEPLTTPKLSLTRSPACFLITSFIIYFMYRFSYIINTTSCYSDYFLGPVPLLKLKLNILLGENQLCVITYQWNIGASVTNVIIMVLLYHNTVGATRLPKTAYNNNYNFNAYMRVWVYDWK